MESKRVTTGAHPLHICDRRQPYRLCSQKNYEPAFNRFRLAVGHHLFTPRYHHLADDGIINKHSFWPV